MIVYAGEYDQRDGPVTQYAWMKDLLKPQPNFWQQARKIWYVNDNLVGGYYRYDPLTEFTFLTIPKAGHFVPTTQLEVSRQMLKDYIENKQLKCHHSDPTKCETKDIMCSYMNNCNNNGACQWNGLCQCNPGFIGGDCSEKVEVLDDGYSQAFSFNGTQWTYFQFSKGLQTGESFEFTLQS